MPVARNHRLVRIQGIDVEYDWSWFVILGLIALTFGQYFQANDAAWGELIVWGAAAITAALFFACVVVHELAHSLVARAHGLPVHTIRLFIFGGVSELTKEPEHAGSEFLIAIVGPLASLAIGGICIGLAKMGNAQLPVPAVLYWLGWINIILAGFNMIPGFPLDGGRVLRSIFWAAHGDFMRATRWATQIGKVVAVLFMIYGLAEIFLQRAELSGLWLAIIGWFLLRTADGSWRQTEAKAALDRYAVGDLSTPFYSSVPADESIEDYFSQLSENHNFRPSMVLDDHDRLLGVITPAELQASDRLRWNQLRVRDLMIPRPRVVTVGWQEGLMDALQKMAMNNVSQLPVLGDDDHLRGIIRRDRIIQILQSSLAQ
ncbi:MAG: site-2 protease family protein [Terriglobales bacterium]